MGGATGRMRLSCRSWRSSVGGPHSLSLSLERERMGGWTFSGFCDAQEVLR